MSDNRWLRNSFVYLIIMIAVVAIIFTFLNPSEGSRREIEVSQVVQDVRAGAVARIVVPEDGNTLLVKYRDGQEVVSRKENSSTVTQLLLDAGVPLDQMPVIEVKAASQWAGWIGTLSFLIPTVFLIVIFLFMMRQAQGSNNQAMSFGKSRARMFMGNKPSVTFADVAGVEEAKEELAEVVDFLKYPDRFSSLGARIPRGVLLVGPPGTGKTLLSKAVAGEAGVPFFSISGSEFVEMFVGVGASRVRDLFEQAKRNSPCIVFVDEIDAVGRQRGAGLGGSHDEREQTLNQILVEMDGFDSTTNVIVIAATNRPDVLDPALLRPGRFDRQVILDRPDIKGREAILRVHARGKPFEQGVNLSVLAKQTSGFSGADLENTVNEAAILAVRRGKKHIGLNELEEAIDRVVAGPERKSRIISENEKRITAFHEVGHALVARMLPHADPVHKISIVARGMMGGYTRFLPDEDRYLWTRSQFMDMLATALGGHVAEELIFDEMTTGPGNDIEQATKMARRMVCEYGMSKKLGPIALGHKEELVFLGREIGEQRNYSDEVAYEIDIEIRQIIDEAYQKAKSILSEHKAKLIEISDLLVQREVLEGDEFESLFDGVPSGKSQPPKPTQPVSVEQVKPKEVTDPGTEPSRGGLQGAPGVA